MATATVTVTVTQPSPGGGTDRAEAQAATVTVTVTQSRVPRFVTCDEHDGCARAVTDGRPRKEDTALRLHLCARVRAGQRRRLLAGGLGLAGERGLLAAEGGGGEGGEAAVCGHAVAD